MKKFFIALLLIMLGFVLGVFGNKVSKQQIQQWFDKTFESISQYWAHWTFKEPEFYLCPAPELAAANQNHLGIFTANALDWAIDYHAWPAPKTINFMQALIGEDNNLTCYYQWPHPKERGAKLWMTVKLSPLATKKTLPFGSFWTTAHEGERSLMCSAGRNACAFSLVSQKQKR